MTDEENAKLVELLRKKQKERMAMYIARPVTATPAAVSAY